MREKISTVEIANRFNKAHKNIISSIKKMSLHKDEIIDVLFKESSYTNTQNKSHIMYEMGLEGFCLLTDTWSFSRGESAYIKAQILNEFGETFTIVGNNRSRFEDDFYRMISECFWMESIIRQFPISSYRADFYFPDYGFIVEYDEEQHFSKKAKESDEQRENGIREYMKNEFCTNIDIIRVKKGEELKGLSTIAGQLALYSHDAIAITKYMEGDS